MGKDEAQNAEAARDARRTGSLPALRFYSEHPSLRSPFRHRTTRARVPKGSRKESQSTRPQTKAYEAFFPRFPRKTLISRFSHLAGEFGVSEPLAHDLRDGQSESVSVLHPLTIVVPKRLLVDVPEKVERLDTDVGAVKPALQEAPEIFHCVRVNVAVHVFNSVVNDRVLVVRFQPVIGFQFVAEDCGASFDVPSNPLLKFRLVSLTDYHRPHLAATLYHSHYDGLVLAPRSGDSLCAFVLVHVARLAADESFVYFYFAGQLAALFALKPKPDAMEHEPCGLLSHTKSTVNLPGTNPVLTVGDEPNRWHPFFEWQRRILHHSAHLDRELAQGMSIAALPAALIRQESDRSAPTSRTDHYTIRPSFRGQVFQAAVGIREILNRSLKGLRLFNHVSIVPDYPVLVKYILALFCQP